MRSSPQEAAYQWVSLRIARKILILIELAREEQVACRVLSSSARAINLEAIRDRLKRTDLEQDAPSRPRVFTSRPISFRVQNHFAMHQGADATGPGPSPDESPALAGWGSKDETRPDPQANQTGGTVALAWGGCRLVAPGLMNVTPKDPRSQEDGKALFLSHFLFLNPLLATNKPPSGIVSKMHFSAGARGSEIREAAIPRQPSAGRRASGTLENR